MLHQVYTIEVSLFVYMSVYTESVVKWYLYDVTAWLNQCTCTECQCIYIYIYQCINRESVGERVGVCERRMMCSGWCIIPWRGWMRVFICISRGNMGWSFQEQISCQIVHVTKPWRATPGHEHRFKGSFPENTRVHYVPFKFSTNALNLKWCKIL